jgi:low affinity Fe/Cu permease
VSSRDEEYEKNVYIIPGNVADSGGIFGGRVRTRNFIEAALVGFIMGLIWWLATRPITSYTIKTALFVILFPFPVLITLIGARDESALQFIMEVIAFRRKRRQMVFCIPRVEKKKAKENKKAGKKDAKRTAKEEKKKAKAAKKAEKKERKKKKRS